MTIQPTTPQKGTLNYSGPDGLSERLLTPSTTLQVQQMLKKALQGEDIEEIIQKIAKAAKLAMVEAFIQEHTNADLLELYQRKEKKANRSKGHYGNAKILNQELLLQRLATKEWNKEWICMRILGPLIFKESRAATKRYQTAIASVASLLISPQKPSQPAALSKPAPSPQPRPATNLIGQGQQEQAPLRALKKIIRLPVRVTTQELNNGRWSMKTKGGQEVVDGVDEI